MSQALKERNTRNVKYIGGFIYAGLGLTSFLLVHPIPEINGIEQESFVPVINAALIVNGVGFSCCSVICFIQANHKNIKMKKNLARARELMMY